MSHYQQILCPVDFSDYSKIAIAKAKELADLQKASLTLLTVVEPLPAIAYGYIDSADLQEQMFDGARKKLTELAAKQNIAADQVRVELGHPKTMILEVAKELNADLIVVGSHGHYGPIHRLLGSTSRTVVNHANCDVTVVRV
jgi:universal stress protein A